MPKALKYILYSLGGLILLLVLLIAGVVMFVDPNDYRDRIEQAASQQIGRSLQINGPMELSFFPWLGVEVQDVTLANAPGFAPQHMLSVHKAGLKVKLLPLISREIQVGTLFLQEAVFNLAKNGQGKSNWQDLADTSSQDKTTPDSKPGQESSPSPAGLAALSIEKIKIQDTHLNWVDNQAGQQIAVRDLNLEMGPLSLGSPVPFSLRCRIENKDNKIQAQLQITGKPMIPRQGNTLHIKDLDITNLVTGESIPGGEAKVHIQTSASMNTQAQTIDIPQFSLSAYDVQLTGQAKGESLDTSPSFTGEISLKKINPKDLLARLKQPRIQTTDPQALTSLQATTQFAATPSQVKLISLKATLDQTTVQGRISADLTPAVPASTFDLHINALDADRYLPPAPQESQPKTEPQKQDPKKAKTAKEKAPSAAALPLAPLRELTVDGQIRMDSLKVNGLRMQEITLTVQAKNGKIDISPLQSRLYGGTLHSTASMDVRDQTPTIRTQTKLDSVQVQSLLQDLTGKGLLSGSGSVNTTLSTQGLDADSLLKALAGNLSLNLQDGSFQGADLLHRVRSLYLTLKGKTPQAPEAEKTNFSSLDFSADIAEGMVRKSDLKLISSLFSIQGSGQLNLMQRSLDYLLQVNFDRNLSGTYPELADLEGKEIPVDVQGSFTDPRLGLNKETLVKILSQEKISQEVDKGVQKLQEKLGLSETQDGNTTSSDPAQKAKDALKSLFGGGKKE